MTEEQYITVQNYTHLESISHQFLNVMVDIKYGVDPNSYADIRNLLIRMTAKVHQAVGDLD